MVVQGMAFGGGSAMAHRAVDAVLGSRHPAPADAAAAAATIAADDADPCKKKAMGFSQCMLDNEGDMGSCEYWFAAMKDCRLGERRAEMQ